MGTISSAAVGAVGRLLCRRTHHHDVAVLRTHTAVCSTVLSVLCVQRQCWASRGRGGGGVRAGRGIIDHGAGQRSRPSARGAWLDAV